MTANKLFTRPHHLLLTRFFSWGFLAAAIVTLITGLVLTRLEQDNYIQHATDSARERVARVAERLTHQMSRMTPEMQGNMRQMLGDVTPAQWFVEQELKYGDMLRLEVVDHTGTIIGAGNAETLGQPSTRAEVAQVMATGKVINQVVEIDTETFLRYVAPIQVGEQTYWVAVDEPLAGMQAVLDKTRRVIISTLALGFIFTFAALSLVVRRAGLEIEHHQQEEGRVKDLLGRYVSHQVAHQILADGGLNIGGERRQITVLFADIRGFTSFSEKLPPERVVTLLNDFLAAMTEVAFNHNGTVDKFLGDGVMIIFGAPISYGDDVDRSLACAADMQAEFNRLRQKWLGEGLPDLGLGIGINTGEAVVGSVGSLKRLDYTAIGDVVNTASRLQAIAAGGQIFFSQAVRERMTQGQSDPVGAKQIKGKQEAIDVFVLKAFEPGMP